MYSLVGVDGNAFAIMGYVSKAMKREGRTQKERDAYIERATSGEYDNLIRESMRMVDSLNEGKEEDDD